MLIRYKQTIDKGACIIEWGEMIENILPKDYIKISFTRVKLMKKVRLLRRKLRMKKEL